VPETSAQPEPSIIPGPAAPAPGSPVNSSFLWGEGPWLALCSCTRPWHQRRDAFKRPSCFVRAYLP
jgi:hypothetical protein